MKEKILNILLDTIIIILIIIIGIIVYRGIASKRSITDNYSTEEGITIDSYDEITIAYSILSKYISCYDNNDYERIQKYLKNDISREVFNDICYFIEQDNISFYDILIDQQQLTSNGEYIVKYSVNDKYNYSMIYKIDKENYSFYIVSDSLIGEFYE